MSNVMRWRYGDASPVTMPVSSTDAVEIGDLVYLLSGVAAIFLENRSVLFRKRIIDVLVKNLLLPAGRANRNQGQHGEAVHSVAVRQQDGHGGASGRTTVRRRS